ncbi:MAG: NAD(P)H-binding protein [Verrucomicrobia bacterium]|nr:NAD(P)H-binding protein [Deltaproteobacteria bacterium]
MEKSQGSILITGATGFIGRRLTQRLLDDGFSVRCMVRRTSSAMPDGAEIIQGDLLEPGTLGQTLAGIDTAYYLVHSMSGGRAGFERRDREAAENFVAAANRANVRRVIYLGGLGETGDDLSEHLKSRLAVADILKKGTFSTTFLRAAVIIGSGGASFEMIRALVKHLPVMITPSWVMTRCQPIDVGDVIDYLAGCLIDERTSGRTFDIGGPEVLTYREMMERLARIQGKKLYILPVPVLTPKLSSYWVGFITPVPASVSMPLIEGLKNEVVCRNTAIRDIIPLQLKPYDDAVRSAIKGG